MHKHWYFKTSHVKVYQNQEAVKNVMIGNFKTSHVKVYRRNIHVLHCLIQISKHPMLKFIGRHLKNLP